MEFIVTRIKILLCISIKQTLERCQNPINKHTTLHVHGKKKKEREIHMQERTLDEIQNHMSWS